MAETTGVSVTRPGAERASHAITTIPQGLPADFGEQPTVHRFVPLGDDRFVSTEPDEGVHAVLKFLDGGRYLYNTRAVRREPQSPRNSPR
jgi:hypothetical protein